MDPMQTLNYVKSPSKAFTSFFVISKLLFLGIAIAQIAIGKVHLNDCPQQHYIPVYLLVSGVFSVFLALQSCLPCSNIICNVWNGLVAVFLFCWLISGSVWIYSINPPNYNQTVGGDPYCNKTLYLFAFWTTTLGYILLAVSLSLGCCFLFCSCISFITKN